VDEVACFFYLRQLRNLNYYLDLDQFETLDKSVEKLNPFVGFQPYLALKNEEDGLNSLEKLQQVLAKNIIMCHCCKL